MKAIVILSTLLLTFNLDAQFGYNIIGNTFGVNNINNFVCGEVDSCFTLTPDQMNQSGAVWDNKPINLLNNFDATFCMTLGSTDMLGADGFAFVLRGQGSMTLGALGSGIGYQNITPSVAIEFDTWENNISVDDIPDDHTGMYINSNYTSPAVSAIPLLPNAANVEDGGYHLARIIWNANTKTLSMFFDGNFRFTHQEDLVNTVFGGNNIVIWGFTASTGGFSNLQQICFPKYSINLNDVKVCQGDTATISYYNPNMTSYTWKYQDGTVIKDWNSLTSPGPFDLNDSTFQTTKAGKYYLDLEINNQVVHDSLNVIFIPYPIAPFSTKYQMTCFKDTTLTLSALNTGGNYLWSTGQTTQQIQVSTEGTYFVRIKEPVLACTTYDTIKVLNFCGDTSICEGQSVMVSFFEPNFTSYKWSYQDGSTLFSWDSQSSPAFDMKDTSIVVSTNGRYFIDLTIDNEALKDSFNLLVIPIPVKPFAESEITACLEEVTFDLDALNAGSSYNWSTGDSTQILTISDPGTYSVEITDSMNVCSNSDTLIVFSVCETIITFPNIFTPNGDNLNDIYQLMFSNSFQWISDFEFQVYNRWGEQVYAVSKEIVKWDGKTKGKELSEGVYFYRCTYKDFYKGKEHLAEGNIQLLR